MKIRSAVVTAFIFLIFKNVSAQEKGIGLGVILGQPTGVSSKAWLTPSTSFDLGAAWNFSRAKPDRGLTSQKDFQVHADYLFHNFSLFPTNTGKMPLYYGIGGRIIFDSKSRMGIRMPIGIDYIINNSKVDIFLEAVPILDLAPATSFNLNAAIGARFWIK